MTQPSKFRRSRTLTDRASGDIWRYKLTQHDAVIESGKPAKPRTRSKGFPSVEAALKYFDKEEWKKLNAGYVLHDPDPKPGDVSLRTYVGGDYTGSLPLAASNDRVFTTRFEKSSDSLVSLDASGQGEVSVEVPGQRLVLDLCFGSELDRLLLNADHCILSCSLDAPQEFESITKGSGTPASCLAVGGSRVAVYDPPNLIVLDGETGHPITKVDCEPQLYGGHSPQLVAALNRDGSVLAVCATPGELSVIRVSDGEKLGEIRGDFQMIATLAFDPSGERLIGLGQYGPWGPLFFDIDSLSCVESPVELPPLFDGAVDLAVHPIRAWLAVASHDQVFVFDLDQSQPIIEFPVQHLAKRAVVQFFGEQLAVRTDLGCLSIHRLTAD